MSTTMRYQRQIMPWLLLTLLLALQGCDDNNHCALGDNSSGKLTDGILVTLSSDRTDLTAGQEARFSFSAANTTDQTKDLIFMSGQQYELYVLNSTETVVWQWSVYNGLAFTLAIKHDILPACSYYYFNNAAPDGSVTLTWKGDDNSKNSLPPGVYTVYVKFVAGSGYESNRRTVTLQ